MGSTEEFLGAARESCAASPGFSVRARFSAIPDLSARAIGAWTDLEQRALEPNAYLSPSFVLPAIRYLDPHARPVVCMLEKEGPAHELLGIGIFVAVRGSLRFPLPHLRAYRSRHSYLGGLLLDRDGAASAAEALFHALRTRHPEWHGVEITGQANGGPGERVLARAAELHGISWHEYGRSQRAMLIPSQAGDAYLCKHLSHGRTKDLRRRRRRLEETGAVRWQVLSGPEITPACIDRLLNLEDRGWKAQHGTSLRARPNDEKFFREVVDGFAARNRAVFTELWAGNRVVASTSNFISGNGGFAFKLGWDPEYHRAAPGFLNEVELIRNAPRVFKGLEFVDSGASEGSFLDELWAARRVLIGGAYTSTPLAGKVMRALHCVRRFRGWLRTGTSRVLVLGVLAYFYRLADAGDWVPLLSVL